MTGNKENSAHSKPTITANANVARIIASVDDLRAWIGEEVACSDWLRITQRDIDRFADVTGDRQWIHVDPARAARESPYGSTVAHGYLTLALLPRLFTSCVRIDNTGIVINYGLDKVRFPAPVLAGQRIRGRLVLDSFVAIEGFAQVHWNATVEIENGAKPACIALMLTRYYPASPATASSSIRSGKIP